MALVLRYFHLDPKATTSSSSITTTLNLMNTSISNNTRAIEDKLNAITGKSLSSNDFTDYYKDKLRGIEEGAEVNVLADWDENDSTADSYIKNKPIIDTVVTENSNNLITSGAVYTAIDNLPEPMIFKGSLGTGGTILSLPSASFSNKGYTYKVITDDTYNGLTAKAGDVFISDGTTWVYIPSADEPNGTVTNVAVTVPTGLEVSGSPITTSGTLAITYAIGYAIPTLTDQAAWTAKQDAISDLSTIRSRADEGHTAYGWGNHANAGYLMAISDLAAIRSRADEGHAAYGWGDHSLAGYQTAISDLATIRSRSDEGHTAYGWGDHSQAGYVKSSGVTSVSMTVPTGLSISGSPITTTGTLALSLANGYSIPTTAKLSNWDTAYGWGDHSLAGYLTGITSAMVTAALGYTPPTTDTNTWRPITDTYTGSDLSTSVSLYGTNALYNALVNGYASSAGDADTVDGYHASSFALNDHTHRYLPLTGGSITGNVAINGNINVYGLNTSSTWVRAIKLMTSNLGDSGVSKTTSILIGKVLSSKNTAEIYYLHNEDGGNNNSLGIGFYGVNVLEMKTSGISHFKNKVYINGNVGIGTTSPTAKLHVDGDTLINGVLYFTRNSPYNGGEINGVSTIRHELADLYIQDSFNTIIGDEGGKLGVYHVDNPSYPLHVGGACAATSFTNTSDIRLKHILSDLVLPIEDIANAPLFLFKWDQNNNDIDTHIGTSAQYWQKLTPELVNEAEDDINTLSLQYDVLGVASSISIAKEVVELKEEIKLLQALIAELKLLLK